MEIMLSHLGVGMAYDALDGLDIHAQRLHLRHIGVAAAVRREQADIARFFQRFAKYIPEMGGIAGQAGLGAFPDELVGSIPQLDGARADIQRHRNIPDTVFGFRTADADCTFYDLYCLPDVNDRAIFFNKLRLQSQKFLHYQKQLPPHDLLKLIVKAAVLLFHNAAPAKHMRHFHVRQCFVNQRHFCGRQHNIRCTGVFL